MQKVVVALSVLLLTVASSARAPAQSRAAEMAGFNDPDCNYVCVFSASVDELWKGERTQSGSVESRPEGERQAAYRSPVPDSGSEILNAMARQVFSR